MIDQIPEVPLRSQPIRMEHKLDFMAEYTRMVFADRLKKAHESRMLPFDYFEELIAIHKELYKDTLYKNEAFRTVFGYEREAIDVMYTLQGSYSRLCKYNISGISGNLEKVFMITHQDINKQMRNTVSTIVHRLNNTIRPANKYYLQLNDKWVSTDVIEKNKKFFEKLGPYYLASGDAYYKDFNITTKSKKDGSPAIRTSFNKFASVPIKDRAIKLRKKYLEMEEPWDKEVEKFFTFFEQLWLNVYPIKTTKQFQERLGNDLFDIFCSITGLGQCDGRQLISLAPIDVVKEVTESWKKQQSI